MKWFNYAIMLLLKIIPYLFYIVCNCNFGSVNLCKLTAANQNIDLTALSSGIYRAAISNKVGQVVKNEKLIKID